MNFIPDPLLGETVNAPVTIAADERIVTSLRSVSDA
jgi:hypothetical protein